MTDLELPSQFEEIRMDWGDFDFGQLLVGNSDQWGDFQGICEPLVIEWEQNVALIFGKCQLQAQKLGIWFESYILDLPPIILEAFEPEEERLPPNFEQLRLELGDQTFAQWLKDNHEQFGNL